jgi:hypothetical protein
MSQRCRSRVLAVVSARTHQTPAQDEQQASGAAPSSRPHFGEERASVQPIRARNCGPSWSAHRSHAPMGSCTVSSSASTNESQRRVAHAPRSVGASGASPPNPRARFEFDERIRERLRVCDPDVGRRAALELAQSRPFASGSQDSGADPTIWLSSEGRRVSNRVPESANPSELSTPQSARQSQSQSSGRASKAIGPSWTDGDESRPVTQFAGTHGRRVLSGCRQRRTCPEIGVVATARESPVGGRACYGEGRRCRTSRMTMPAHDPREDQRQPRGPAPPRTTTDLPRASPKLPRTGVFRGITASYESGHLQGFSSGAVSASGIIIRVSGVRVPPPASARSQLQALWEAIEYLIRVSGFESLLRHHKAPAHKPFRPRRGNVASQK